MKIHVTTDGCEVGRLSSQNIYRFFSTFDAEIVYTSDPKEADLIVFYACGLTKGQEEKSMGLIAAFKKEAKPSARIVVWGCLPKQNPELLKMGFDGPLIGPSDSQAFEEIIAEMVEVPKISSSLEIPDVHIPITQMLSNESPVKLRYLRHILSRAIFFGFESSPYYVRIAEGCTTLHLL